MAPLKYIGIVYFTIEMSKNQVATSVAEKMKPMQKCLKLQFPESRLND